MTHQYLLLLHETPARYADMSADEMQEIVARYAAWAQQMAEQGHLAGGEKLVDDGGRQLRLVNGRPVATDGPYAEAHDVIGGTFVLKAESDAQAEALAATCPHLNGGNWIELRRIDPVN
ncbi:YciI family protein [Ideonella azotifigens]|uniref:YciI family protein n=1 Tax=Ideonella azotifigens TaxID=513160 RepID=A0ABN1KEC1_9BURK|nr:YciI family protein [Ideonella azotifigens]MCD2344524.1 YciI family protein [Ideonella azotifigens]